MEFNSRQILKSNSFIMKKIIIITSVLLSICDLAISQNHQKALAAADTGNFLVNKKEGWKIYNSCLKSVTPDSILIGLILQNEQINDWTTEQMVGKIKSGKFFPETARIMTFNLIADTYQLRVEKNGKCYLKLLSGSLPDNSGTVILPIKGVYKK